MFSLLATLFSAAAIVSAQSSCARSYTVKDGDYCDAISAAQNVSTYQLAVSNYQTVNDGCTNLEIGQSLCLGNTGQDCQTTYIVKQGDYCDLISGNFGINSTLLQTNNPQIDDNCYNLYVGEVLCVATTVLVTPAPAGWTLPGANLDDGSFDDGSDAPIVVLTTTAVATPAPTTVAVATTSAAVVKAAVDNAVAAPASLDTSSSNTDDEEDCDDGTASAASTDSDDDDSEDDDDIPDCED